ncbi:Uncharacterized protein EJ110_NYTH45080 [Nymphaea thermarum]|nr:Uncharacterized protein EJ110_NYTH45080 [Nymphaea thermarum]
MGSLIMVVVAFYRHQITKDQIPPFPSSVALKSIESQLGAPISQIFADISPEPIAAASLGQVRHMFEEIDYILEAQNADRFAALYACYPSLAHTTLRVLTAVVLPTATPTARLSTNAKDWLLPSPPTLSIHCYEGKDVFPKLQSNPIAIKE